VLQDGVQFLLGQFDTILRVGAQVQRKPLNALGSYTACRSLDGGYGIESGKQLLDGDVAAIDRRFRYTPCTPESQIHDLVGVGECLVGLELLLVNWRTSPIGNVANLVAVLGLLFVSN
jgi:hypothetical protein